MTVSSTTTPRTQYAGNGSTTAFPTVFTFDTSADLVVVLTDTGGTDTTLTLTTHYTVTGGSSSTGTVTMVTAPASGEYLTIYRRTSRKQESDYQDNNIFPAEVNELALDKLTRIVQELDYDLSRATLGSVTSGVTGITLPSPVALNLLRWNAGATNLENTTVADIGSYAFPAGTGILVQSATSTALARTLTGTTDQITVTNGTGVSGNPTIAFASTVDLTGSTVKLKDSTLTIEDNSDSTKKVAFECSGITTATTRTLTVPNANGTIALTSDITAGAPAGAQYVTLATDATLTSERVLTAGTGISIADGGAGGNVTISQSAGAVLQVVQGTLTTTATTSSTTFVDTGLTVNITPSSSSNKILVWATLPVSQSSSANRIAAKVVRGSTDVLVGAAAGSRLQAQSGGNINGANNDTVTLMALDSPATTSSTTYKIQWAVSAGTGYINQESADTNTATTMRYAASIVVMEIKG